ncbi:hypothetical protein EOA85_33570 [Mesorhizobium sp. M5C.F.Ca.IN.020.29.1.1]|uniref:hypothetical protein n=1 Tax=unclassified Mesorhizobium TaxID=325217 RepID=UPI000FCB0FE7|nr:MULTISPECIES: hypothetical protein [unclassified Mesorhizobium]RUV48171.1 hypothetical protein EOA85_33570 [Mesorhizobium sp. M5C.F.Ca.IN.020.29.1.1]TIM84010.1 MAG: hypothetical protein E5Y50_23650 [Mesorhizobium sp.]
MDDDQFEEMYRRNPLKAFSIYTVTQLQSLRRMAFEIKAARDQKDPGPDIMKAYDFFWFWTLGAYAIIRTMTQHKQCFSSKIASASSPQTCSRNSRKANGLKGDARPPKRPGIVSLAQ